MTCYQRVRFERETDKSVSLFLHHLKMQPEVYILKRKVGGVLIENTL